MNNLDNSPTIVLARRPALKIVLVLAAGILLGRYVDLDIAVVLAATVLIYLVGAVAGLRISSRVLANALQLLSIVLIGASLQLYQRDEFSTQQLIPVTENEVVVFEGVIAEEPSVRPNRIQFVLDVRALARAGVVQSIERWVVVHGRPPVFAGQMDKLGVGARVTGRGVLEDYPQQRNPGEFDYGRYLELNGIHGIVAVKESETLVVSGGNSGETWWMFPRTLRAFLLTEIDSLHSAPTAAFLRGILLADRSKIPEEVRQSFVETGTIHVLAVSGLHVGVVALVFYGVFGLLRLPRRIIVLCTIAGLLFYMVMVGAPASVVRATVMAIVILVGMMLERKTDVYQSLSVAALLLLMWDSNNLFNVGFQLSFAAVLAIVYFYPILASFIRKLPEGLLRIRPVEWGLQLFAVSLAAQIGTLPFTAYYFDQFSIVSLLVNVVVVPVVGINVMLGFTTLVLSPMSAWLASAYAALNDLLVSLLLVVVRFTASVPFASVNTASVGASFPFFYYAGVLGAANFRNRAMMKFLLIGGLLVGNIAVFSSMLRAEDGKLRVTFIDVWQGDAMLLELTSGKTILLDAGNRTDTFDSGERTVAPFLRYKGIGELDALIMSHPHSDHIGGVSYLVENFPVKQLLEPTVRGESFTYEEIHRKAAERSIPVARYEAGNSIEIDASVRLYVLHPFFQQDSTVSLNNASLVVKLVYGSTELLLVGDAEAEVEEKLVRRYGDFITSAVLKVGHHGSMTSSSEEFLRAVRPASAVISVGKNNKFGHPSQEVLQRLRRSGVEIYRTDKHGAVIIESNGREWSSIDWRED